MAPRTSDSALERKVINFIYLVLPTTVQYRIQRFKYSAVVRHAVLRIRIRMVTRQSEKPDPDPRQCKKSDPDSDPHGSQKQD